MGSEARKRVVLVGEDDEPIATLIQELIAEQPGYDAVVVPDGARIVEEARKLHADLLILDIMMPGLDGLEVYDRVRADAALSAMPVLFLTAAAPAYAEQFRKRNITDVVQKPFDLNELIERVRALCPARDLATN